jgi:thioredoxin 1
MTRDLVRHVQEADFEAEVLAAPVPVLVDFTAAWCSPCRALKPILEQVALEGRGRRLVVAVDGDESPAIAMRYGVRGFPTLILFSGGKEVARRIGLCSKQQLLGMLQPHEAAAAPPSPAPRV